jgi:hypothetical protein
VGWGSGEDEETGAILKVQQALGIFYFEEKFSSWYQYLLYRVRVALVLDLPFSSSWL